MLQGGQVPPLFCATNNMNYIHDLLWAYLKAVRNPATLSLWLREANAILVNNGHEKQDDALDAQRLLKSITKHYMLFL